MSTPRVKDAEGARWCKSFVICDCDGVVAWKGEHKR